MHVRNLRQKYVSKLFCIALYPRVVQYCYRRKLLIPYSRFSILEISLYVNQACAGLRPACAWFLRIDPVRIIGMCVRVCVSAPEAIYN